jgi:hypothetical protein
LLDVAFVGWPLFKELCILCSCPSVVFPCAEQVREGVIAYIEQEIIIDGSNLGTAEIACIIAAISPT